MNKIGRKIYYDKSTGNIILDTGEMMGAVIETTVNQDIATFTVLSERNRDTFDVLQLEYGQYAQDFAECNGYRVNPETKELEFSYPDPSQPDAQQEFRAPLSAEIESLKEKVSMQDTVIEDLMFNIIPELIGGVSE
ncbi:hypothetical protein JK635_01800 [Neobacillus sp. YIM B02564]|uniref:Uncharacterized protein n=1 Tax=Neobacillus paridis TaxID=2803862 RepID=A0ABS1TI77_9BACI|nr:hypothetical protein [Neobacillus paridis]MBL4950972.1 hypothetical protein [Neobacillus paridis]